MESLKDRQSRFLIPRAQVVQTDTGFSKSQAPQGRLYQFSRFMLNFYAQLSPHVHPMSTDSLCSILRVCTAYTC